MILFLWNQLEKHDLLESVIAIYDKFVSAADPLLNFIPVYKLSQDHTELFFGSIISHGDTMTIPHAGS
jgi:hypothetical protein